MEQRSAAGEEKKYQKGIRGAPGRRKQRRRRDGILQGLIRNYRKLQGPICKTKFPVDLKL
jgi:hypothetical protein